MNCPVRLFAALICVLAPACAQTGKTAAAGPAPRLPNIPYLGANAGKPDLGNNKGMWDVPRIYEMNKAQAGVTLNQEVPFTALGKKTYDERIENLQKFDPEARCMPPGVPRMLYTPYPAQIFQLPDRVLFIYEGGTHIWRTIYVDGRAHPKDINPTWLGDSVGHWEGDTLVVDVTGFNGLSWLDNAGHPHGDKLHVTERFTRPDVNTLHYEATIEDPDYYTKAWTVPLNIKWRAGQELYEYICQENNKDVEHLVGK